MDTLSCFRRWHVLFEKPACTAPFAVELSVSAEKCTGLARTSSMHVQRGSLACAVRHPRVTISACATVSASGVDFAVAPCRREHQSMSSLVRSATSSIVQPLVDFAVS